MINILQAGRFIAAMAVVMYHAVISVTAFSDSPPFYVKKIFQNGYLGVDFFFVLSGFIIHYTMRRSPLPAKEFSYSRLTRIFLPYWPVAIVLALAYTIRPQFSAGNRSWGWLSTVTLIPSDLPPSLSVAWTLQHEILFYMLYAVLFFYKNIFFGLAFWVAAIVAAQMSDFNEVSFFRIILAPINLEFIAGVMAAAVFIGGPSISGLITLSVSAILFFCFIVAGADSEQRWIFGFAIAVLLPWLCHQEKIGKFKIPVWLAWGGSVSYAIYLVHTPILSLTSRGIGALGLGWALALSFSALICAAAGSAYYMVWERPIMRVAKWYRF